ncbi:MAG: hypothetical protein A6F70_06610 [Cycloclasticus sp. symbiont of Bathymodiolus heckerae]|nr:MAG: hypothetical protein A6F70_06610 [Cycloclasticus sp. symbiont of Bathymodiolus heckerae]
MKGVGKAIQVDVYSDEISVFKQSKEDLLSLGYAFRFCNDLASFASPQNIPDVCIVELSKLDESHDVLRSLDKPYLVSGVNFHNNHTASSDALEHSVGFINGAPSVSDICVNIRLGLLWHKEREHFSRRGQDIDEKIRNNRMTGIAVGMLMHKSGLVEEDVLNCLKSTSRSKQRRMVDASCEIIENIHKSNELSLDSVDLLEEWLLLTVSHRT